MLEHELQDLDPAQRARFEEIRVPFRQVPVASEPGDHVTVVAECSGRILYYSSVEEGWELDTLDAGGRLPERGCNQLTLGQLLNRVFGARR